MNTDDKNNQDLTLDQLLAETLDLVDQRTARVTDDEIETRLRQVLAAAGQAAEPPQPSALAVEAATSAAAVQFGFGDVDPAHILLPRKPQHDAPAMLGTASGAVSLTDAAIAQDVQQETFHARVQAVRARREADSAWREVEQARRDAEMIRDAARRVAEKEIADAQAEARRLLDIARADAAATTARARREASEILATTRNKADLIANPDYDVDAEVQQRQPVRATPKPTCAKDLQILATGTLADAFASAAGFYARAEEYLARAAECLSQLEHHRTPMTVIASPPAKGRTTSTVTFRLSAQKQVDPDSVSAEPVAAGDLGLGNRTGQTVSESYTGRRGPAYIHATPRAAAQRLDLPRELTEVGRPASTPAMAVAAQPAGVGVGTAVLEVGEKGRRVVGAERRTLAKDLVRRYTSGESIRALAASTGRSYGFVHRVLTESGVQIRQRGGARRRKKA